MKSNFAPLLFLRRLAFSLMGLIALLLLVATFVEKLFGTAMAVRYFYTAPWTIVLWACAALFALLYLCYIRMQRTQFFTFLLHFSFVVILAGALLTHLMAKEGTLHLRIGESAEAFCLRTGNTERLPFVLQLDTFFVDFYPGTRAPMDYVSRLSVLNTDKQGMVSMNNIFTYHHFRFYQTRYDADAKGTTYTVISDPYGIALTYAGYLLLLLSIIGFFWQRHTQFRSLWTELRGKTLLIFCALLLCHNTTLFADDTKRPATLQKGLADSFGTLYINYGDRVCPVNTLAVDFCTKLCGRPSWKGLTANQVLAGWLFYYDDWKNEPMLRVKGKEVRNALQTDDKYVALSSCYGNEGYRLQTLLQEGDPNARVMDEKVQLISMVAMGSIFKIFPHTDSLTAGLHWYSWADNLPRTLPYEQWKFERRVMDYVALNILEGKNIEANETLLKLRLYQTKNADDALPKNGRIHAEIFYSHLMSAVQSLAMAYMTLGLLFFFFACFCLVRRQLLPLSFRYMGYVLLLVLFLFLSLLLGLRWWVSGHTPVANGFETMQFLAWATLLLTLSLSHCFSLLLPFGCLFSGMALMVSFMGAANPRITLLMPVLQSPLLSLHVMIIMLAYALLAFVMLNGVVALVLAVAQRGVSDEVKRLQTVSRLLLYPAVFCLTIGIFVGAVWANVSWGRYWGWDPKEVWALLTMLVYTLPLHSRSLTCLQKPIVFHAYVVVAFLCVLFTYFGVNLLLGGMHGYA